VTLPSAEQLRTLPPLQQVRCGDETLACSVSGGGAPTLVLLNGSGGTHEAWARLHAGLAGLGTVVAYDRPGVGRSPAPVRPQTGAAVVETLRRLLAQLEVPRPYVLVAHSFGGLHAQLFARLHPGEIGGVVLLDATAPEDVLLLPAHRGALARALDATSRALSFLRSGDPDHEVSRERETVAQLAAAPPFPPVPLHVVSGGKRPPAWLLPPVAFRLRQAHQEGLARLSPLARHTVAPGSGHFPHLTEPDVVLAAVADVVAQVRRGGALQGRG
jgi:pimeloyl-ACP methyl ester carboxylesterase